MSLTQDQRLALDGDAAALERLWRRRMRLARVRALRAEGKLYREIAADLGCGVATVGALAAGRGW